MTLLPPERPPWAPAVDELGPLPELHPRQAIVETAELELLQAWARIVVKHELTRGERLKVMTETARGEVQDVARQLIRWERHGSTEKPGDEL